MYLNNPYANESTLSEKNVGIKYADNLYIICYDCKFSILNNKDIPPNYKFINFSKLQFHFYNSLFNSSLKMLKVLLLKRTNRTSFISSFSLRYLIVVFKAIYAALCMG